MWTLVPLTAFRRVRTAWRCSIVDAMMHNLMSTLAGDFAVSFVEGAACRVLVRRTETTASEKVSDTERHEEWLGTIEDFSVTGGDGAQVDKFPSLLLWLLLTLGEWTEEETTTPDTFEIVRRYEGGMGFIHQCLALAFEAEDSPLPPPRLWKARLDAWKPRFTAASARKVLVAGLKVGLVHIIADIQPKHMPAFLPRRKPDPSRYFVVK